MNNLICNNSIKYNKDEDEYVYGNRKFIIDTSYGSIYERMKHENLFIGKLNGRKVKTAIADILSLEYFN